mgnify:CR=1 FL=1|tara:strand:+ start:1461 stop:1673 length:213 start_codon:yes stop_codon:yes gene_type:complete
MSNQSAQDKWDRGKTLLLESLYKPDSKLRGCAYNQDCYDEMISLRDHVIELVKEMKNPHVDATQPLSKWR